MTGSSDTGEARADASGGAQSASNAATRAPQRRTTRMLRECLSRARATIDRMPWLIAWTPYLWRLRVRRSLYALAGRPMAPLPLPPGRRRALQPGRFPDGQGGANLIGYAHGEFGIAESLRAYARSLAQTGYPFAIFDLDVGDASRQLDRSMDAFLSNDLRYDTNLFFLNADQMPIAHSVLGGRAFESRYNIGSWLWELERFPRDWRATFRFVDEVWVPTAFVRAAIGPATGKPVLRMPMAVEATAPLGNGRARYGLPRDAFVYLFSFDFNGFVTRKNPAGVIDAFQRAFGDGAQDVRLLLKTANGQRFPDQLAALRRHAGNDPRIEVRDTFLSRVEMYELQGAIDCYVSLHRAEGFGLGMAECMYLGKPVIATGYSGNLDFMDRTNSFPVDYRLVPLDRGDYPYWRGQHWAEPDIADAARRMREVRDRPELARQMGAAAAASIRRTHSRAASAAAMAARLNTIHGQARAG